MEHVAVLHEVVFALEAEFARFFGTLLATEGVTLEIAPDAIRLGAPHLRAAAASEAEQQRLRARIEHIHRHRVRVWLPAAADAREAALLPSLGADGWQAADASGSLP